MKFSVNDQKKDQDESEESLDRYLMGLRSIFVLTERRSA
jgi:hypothetical protein